jgi:hypothetical protein
MNKGRNPASGLWIMKWFGGARNAPKAPLFDPPYRFQLIRKAAA